MMGIQLKAYSKHASYINIDRQIENCYFVKFILMLFVVLYHSLLFWKGDWFTVYSPSKTFTSIKYLSMWIGTFHVYGFVLVSGYLFFYLHHELEKYTDYKRFVLSKVKRLIIPYCLVCVLWVIPISTYYYHYSIKDILYKYILGANPSQMWFLLALFWTYIISWLMIKYIKSDIGYVAFSLALYIIGFVGGLHFTDFYCFFRSLQFVAFFTCGYLLRKYKTEQHRNTYIYMGIILHVLLFIGKIYIQMNALFESGYDLILHLVSSIVLFEILQIVGTNTKWSNNKIIKVLINYSMTIFLFHQQIIYLFISILNNKINGVYIIAICFAFSIGGSIGVGCLLKKHKLTSIMIGE